MGQLLLTQASNLHQQLLPLGIRHVHLAHTHKCSYHSIMIYSHCRTIVVILGLSTSSITPTYTQAPTVANDQLYQEIVIVYPN